MSSIFGTLFIGTSGLKAMGDGIGVVGDNIANASTIGFKGARANFKDVLGGSTASGQRIGGGVRLASVDTLFGQGSLINTGRTLDLAVRGNGFFMVQGVHDGIEDTYFTRDGQFFLDEEGFLVNQEGLRVQGFDIDAAGVPSSILGDLQIGDQSEPLPTSNVTMALNLDSTAAVPAAAFDPLNAGATSNFSTSVTVFDSLGAEHRIDVFFRSNGNGGWEWHALADGGELSGGVAGTPTEIANGTLTFNTDGSLQAETTIASSADFLNATPGQVINFDFGQSIAEGGTGLEGSTQFASPFSINSLVQDGFGAGALVNIVINDNGEITGQFSNGQDRPLARLALATFAADQGLRRAGGQLFSESIDSGQPLIEAAAEGGRGAISSGALEASNVDLSDELVTLIAYQRAFQANSRTITTSDEMLQEVNSLKR
jgi:flagellar hook protein FlgE